MRLLTSALFVAALAIAGCDAVTPDASLSATAQAPATEAHSAAGDAIAEIRRATAKYHRVERALADGYALSSPCVYQTDNGKPDGTEVAAMGYHYVNRDLIDGTIDPAAPEILLYEPMKNGTLRLVSVEFMTPAAAWDPASPPTFEGEAFDAHLTPDVQHSIPFPHYDLHVWTWRENPDGMFTPHNPKVSCQYAPPPAS